jgi:hypothetical protein
MGKPLFKALEGGRVDILRQREDVTQSEFQQVSGMRVPIRLKVRPCLRRSGYAQAGRSLSPAKIVYEAGMSLRLHRTVHPCPYGYSICNIKVYSFQFFFEWTGQRWRYISDEAPKPIRIEGHPRY